MKASTIVEVTPHALRRYRSRFKAESLSHAKALHAITRIVLACRRPCKRTCKKLQQVWQGSTNVTRAAKQGRLWWNADRKCVVIGRFVKPKHFICRTIIVPDFSGGNVSKAHLVVCSSQPLFSFRASANGDGWSLGDTVTIFKIAAEDRDLFGPQHPFLRVNGNNTKNPTPLTKKATKDLISGVLEQLGGLAVAIENDEST